MRHLKDGEPWREQFGPEDFEDEHDARERRASDRDNLRKADLLRVSLKQFERNFDVRVTDDAQSGAQCRHCLVLLTGDRQQPTKLTRLLRAHKCPTDVWIPPVYDAKVYEEAFS